MDVSFNFPGVKSLFYWVCYISFSSVLSLSLQYNLKLNAVRTYKSRNTIIRYTPSNLRDVRCVSARVLLNCIHYQIHLTELYFYQRIEDATGVFFYNKKNRRI